ncbi:threonine--tRNA ligase [Nakamurella sp. A5-74]|uniref:threonine--tRNA ligase n=1 Tax=Nakamurella sp. A5-74 TaxID=3158264 RepID=A0AAU8DTI4_9ACTN
MPAQHDPSSAADPALPILSADPSRPSTLDHRVIGREMGIYTTHPLAGAGLPLWLPAGAVVRYELEQYAREIALATGCSPVYSPVLGKRALFERSGHWAKFADDMFPPMPVGGDELVLRPANCPHHAMIYAAEIRSHRDLPIRLNELAPMFRAERSGVLSGLSRVRQIDLDDTHVFCRPDQVAPEVAAALQALLDAYEVLGISVDHLRLSRRGSGDGYLGAAEHWAAAEDRLRAALVAIDLPRRGLHSREVAGEAAFYGPKIDVQVRDARGQVETLGTVQLDFNQPERFDLRYTDSGGARPLVSMIHRGTLGAMERMVALLLEVHRGRLPLWLAPVQVCLLPVSAAQRAAADQAANLLRCNGVRLRLEAEGSLGSRIRAASGRRDSLLVVVGEDEVSTGAMSVHDPATDVRVRLPAAVLAERMSAAIRLRALRVDLGSA